MTDFLYPFLYFNSLQSLYPFICLKHEKGTHFERSLLVEDNLGSPPECHTFMLVTRITTKDIRPVG